MKMDEKTLYRLTHIENAVRSKSTVIALAFALHLESILALDLLAKAGFCLTDSP